MELRTLIICQVALLVYHQITTTVDFYPFNGARHYTTKEKLAECGVNGLLMALPPIGFGWHLHGLMKFGLVYYFVLFFIEVTLWWMPYLIVPEGQGGGVYNRLLALAMMDFGGGDLYSRWRDAYERLHSKTFTMWPRRPGRIVPNLEHTILHAWTLVTAIVTAVYYARL
jgi:hypothetical protein